MALVSRLRLSSIALVVALSLALLGLVLSDQALRQSERTRIQLDAVESAALLEGFLDVHAHALYSLRGLYVDTSRAPTEVSFHILVAGLAQPSLAFRRVWVTDSAGRVTYQHLFGPGAPLIPVGLDLDTMTLLNARVSARTARRSRQAQITRGGRVPSGERGFAILLPMFVGDRFLGFAGGTVTAASVVNAITKDRSLTGAELAVVAAGDTMAAAGPGHALGPFQYRAAADLGTPLTQGWRVNVARPARDRSVAVILWAVGLATLGALTVTLLRERREAARVAERSAELERLSTELLRANRAKSEFLANVSHELRTPLNAIVGFVDLLRDGVYGDLSARQVNPVERIAASANHLRHLVDQILDIAKIAAGRMEVHPEPVDLRPFVLDVASEVEALVSERGLNFSLAVGGSLPRVRTDPTHLRQILVNLIGNAVKYTHSGGIAVRARVVDERALGGPVGTSPAGAPKPGRAWVALQVADSGIGIAPGDRERIFEEFEQVNAGPRGDSMRRGTGLGLPISRRLARLLGGDVVVESELGKGSTFTVWLAVDPADLRQRGGEEITPSDALPAASSASVAHGRITS